MANRGCRLRTQCELGEERCTLMATVLFLDRGWLKTLAAAERLAMFALTHG